MRNKWWLNIIGVLFIVSCQTSQQSFSVQQDGPPLVSKDSSIKKPQKVIAKVEARSRYGNPDSYHVLGKTYHVLDSANSFKQTGLASWYGTKFHDKRTSSGEPYNMHALTAAHKTLPLPTYVKVYNQDNGREIVVKVNDRGPFHEGRIIDLSYAAAKALGVVKNGVAHVVVEAVALAKYQDPQFYLQVGAFKERHKAKQYQQFLERFITMSDVRVETKKTSHVVIVGPFKQRFSRNEVKKQLVMHGVEGAFSFMR